MSTEQVNRYIVDAEHNYYCVECGGPESQVRMDPMIFNYAVRCPAGHVLTMRQVVIGEQ